MSKFFGSDRGSTYCNNCQLIISFFSNVIQWKLNAIWQIYYKYKIHWLTLINVCQSRVFSQGPNSLFLDMRLLIFIENKSEFGPGLKRHDWNTFIKISHNILYLQYICEIAFNFHCIMLEKNEMISWELLQYVLPLSLPNNFGNNIKQVIYDLGKYMR